MKARSIVIVSLLALFAGYFASCSGPQHPREIATLDSLQAQLDSAEKKLYSIDSVQIFTAIDEIEADMHYVQTHFMSVSKDSLMDRETATILTDYRSVLKPMKLYKRELGKLVSNIDYSQSQIANLKHDLEKGAVDEKDVAKYVESERLEAKKSIDAVERIATVIKDLMPRYNDARPKVKQYVDGLKAQDTTSTQ